MNGWMRMRRRGYYVSTFRKKIIIRVTLLKTNLPSRVGLVLAWKNCTLHVERYGCLHRRDYCPTFLAMCAIFMFVEFMCTYMYSMVAILADR